MRSKFSEHVAIAVDSILSHFISLAKEDYNAVPFRIDTRENGYEKYSVLHCLLYKEELWRIAL